MIIRAQETFIICIDAEIIFLGKTVINSLGLRKIW